jgi:hypothetical protein
MVEEISDPEATQAITASSSQKTAFFIVTAAKTSNLI